MRAFVCNILPDSLIVKLNAPQAPQNFCKPFINEGAFDAVCSIIPMSYYSKEIYSADNIIFFQCDFSKWKIGKIVGLIVSNIRCAWYLRKYKSIWFYNICKTHLFTYLLLRYVFCCKTYSILLDYTPCTNKFCLSYYFPYLYRHSYGVISLSMRSDIIHQNMRYKAGVTSIHTHTYKSKKTNVPIKFLFSGAIAEHTGFPLAYEVFKNTENIELYVSGIGNVEKYQFDKYPNIHYLGYLEYKDYLDLYNHVDVCLSFRNPAYPENRNNFPSKIIEYFSYNKIVISTIDYPELRGFTFFKADYNVESIQQIIQDIIHMPKEKVNIYKDNVDVLRDSFSVESWIESFNEIEYETTRTDRMD